MRTAITDGEMSNLSMDFGQLLCWGLADFQPLTEKEIKAGKKPWKNLRVLELDDYQRRRWDDRGLATRVRDELSKYDLIVTWNGVRFDIPALNTRLHRWGRKEFLPKRHKDLMYTARYKLRLSNATQDNVAKFYNIEARYGVAKTPMQPEQWTMALGGHYPSFRYIVRHCENDIKVLAALWQEMLPIAGEIK
jgi:hypothetical protein